MNKSSFISTALLQALFVSACSTAPTLESTLPEDIQGHSRNLFYDALSVSVIAPSEGRMWADIDGSGAAAAEGFQMMLVAPLGCLQGGMFAGMCMAAAPFFPIIAAVRAEKPEVSRAELETLEGIVGRHDLRAKLETELRRQIAAERLPVADTGIVDPARTIVEMTVVIPAIELEHSGYKNGRIKLAVPYSIVVSDGDGNVLMRRSKRLYKELDHGAGAASVHPLLDEWIAGIAEHAVDEVILEWQPAIRLDHVYPVIERKRTWLGIRHTEWVAVDSLTPTLAWQPLAAGMPADELAGVTDISYEVDVYGFVRTPGDTYWKQQDVLEVRGLSDPRYEVENALFPCQRYYWKPRARFSRGGNLHTTSADEAFVLITPGPDCDNPAWLLPDAAIEYVEPAE